MSGRRWVSCARILLGTCALTLATLAAGVTGASASDSVGCNVNVDAAGETAYVSCGQNSATLTSLGIVYTGRQPPPFATQGVLDQSEANGGTLLAAPPAGEANWLFFIASRCVQADSQVVTASSGGPVISLTNPGLLPDSAIAYGNEVVLHPPVPFTSAVEVIDLNVNQTCDYSAGYAEAPYGPPSGFNDKAAAQAQAGGYTAAISLTHGPDQTLSDFTNVEEYNGGTLVSSDSNLTMAYGTGFPPVPGDTTSGASSGFPTNLVVYGSLTFGIALVIGAAFALVKRVFFSRD